MLTSSSGCCVTLVLWLDLPAESLLCLQLFSFPQDVACPPSFPTYYTILQSFTAPIFTIIRYTSPHSPPLYANVKYGVVLPFPPTQYMTALPLTSRFHTCPFPCRLKAPDKGSTQQTRNNAHPRLGPEQQTHKFSHPRQQNGVYQSDESL